MNQNKTIKHWPMFSYCWKYCHLLLLLNIIIPISAFAAGPLHTDKKAHVLHNEVPTEDYFNTDQYLTGNWDGVRNQWYKAGFSTKLNYTAEPMQNFYGGEETGGTYFHNIDLDFNLDFSKMFSGSNTSFLMKVSQRSGKSTSARYIAPSEGGNTFTVQEVYGEQVTRIVNFQFETNFLNEQLNVAYGRIVANDDFLRSPLYCGFINNSFCGSPKAVFEQNPFAFSAYPTAQWGIRGRYNTESRNWTFQGAIYDADVNDQNGDPSAKDNNSHGTNWEFGGNGSVFAGEVHYHVNRDSTVDLPAVYKVGAFYMNGDYQDLSQTDNSTVDGNAMVWFLIDKAFYRETPGSSEGLAGFLSIVYSLKDEANTQSEYFNAGMLYTGFFDKRSDDVTGFGITAGWFSDESNKGRKSLGKKNQDYEAVVELNHKFVFTRGIAITPDLQYVIKPAGTGDIDNAWVVGARVSVDF